MKLISKPFNLDVAYIYGSQDNANVTVNTRFRMSILLVTGYPGADYGNDHIHIVATLKGTLQMRKSLNNLKRLTESLTMNIKHHFIQVGEIQDIDNLEDRC